MSQENERCPQCDSDKKGKRIVSCAAGPAHPWHKSPPQPAPDVAVKIARLLTNEAEYGSRTVAYHCEVTRKTDIIRAELAKIPAPSAAVTAEDVYDNFEAELRERSQGYWPTGRGFSRSTICELMRVYARSAQPDAQKLAQLLSDVQEEFRLIRMKDTDAVYDPTLKLRIQLALAALLGKEPR